MTQLQRFMTIMMAVLLIVGIFAISGCCFDDDDDDEDEPAPNPQLDGGGQDQGAPGADVNQTPADSEAGDGNNSDNQNTSTDSTGANEVTSQGSCEATQFMQVTSLSVTKEDSLYRYSYNVTACKDDSVVRISFRDADGSWYDEVEQPVAQDEVLRGKHALSSSANITAICARVVYNGTEQEPVCRSVA
ncbi:MAG: hypothetical protein ACOCWQ_05485 [Nanoarchaeota archaeon]